MLSQTTELIQIILDETDEYTKLNFSYTNQTTILYFLHMFYKEHYFVHNEKFSKNQKSKIMKLEIFGRDRKSGITKLKYPYYLNQLKDYENLIHLTFYPRFNQPKEHDVLPKSLTHLTFGVEFNQNIKFNILPKGLMYLVIRRLNDKINLDSVKKNYPELKII